MLNPKPCSRVRLTFCGVFEEANGDGDKSEQVDEYEEAAPEEVKNEERSCLVLP